MATLNKITLYHFVHQNWGADLEAARLAFAISGVAFEDKRLPRGSLEWEEFKGEGLCPFDQFPILQLDDQIISQSNSILRACGRIAGVYPSDPLMAAKVDEILCAILDIKQRFFPSMVQTDPERKIQMRTKWIREDLRNWLGNLEAVIQANASLCMHKNNELGEQLKKLKSDDQSGKKLVLRQDLEEVLKRHGRFAQQELDCLFRTAGEDENGFIDYDRFVNFVCFGRPEGQPGSSGQVQCTVPAFHGFTIADLALECFIGWLEAGVLTGLDSLTAKSLLENCPCIQAVCKAVQENRQVVKWRLQHPPSYKPESTWKTQPMARNISEPLPRLDQPFVTRSITAPA